MTEKNKKRKSKITFSSDSGDSNVTMNQDTITDGIRGNLNPENRLRKSVRPVVIKEDLYEKVPKNKAIFSVKSYDKTLQGVEEKSWRRLSDAELKELSQIDPYISSIISTRCNQGQIIGRISESKYDKGTRIYEKDPLRLSDFESKEEYIRANKISQQRQKYILDWVTHCGTKDDDILNAAYADSIDKTFKKCNLSEYISSQVRNLLTFGRCATQVFRDPETHAPIFFRPVAVETIRNVAQDKLVHVGRGRDTEDQSIQDAEAFNKLDDHEKPFAYVQKVNGRDVNFFTEDDLIITHFQKQALFDLDGYPLAPIEQAIYMVFVHQNTLAYMRNQFVKGLGTKGVLVLSSTDPTADMSPEDLDTLRREFHNFLCRSDNSATTPVLAGQIKAEFLSLTSTPRDMEFLQIEEHVIRSLCSAMNISPQEMGYGHLSMNQGSLTSSNKQEEIVRGEERGLRALLDVIYDTVNDITFESFSDSEDKYSISYTGVGEDTRDAAIQRGAAELQTTATMNSLWADSEKTDPIPIGGDVPLCSAFHQNVIRYLKYGDFLENFMGKKGASKDPLYDFIIDPQLNAAYQQKISMTDQMMREQGEIQVEQQKIQLEQLSSQIEAMNQQQNQNTQTQEQPGQNDQSNQEDESEDKKPAEEETSKQDEMPKSLAQAYREKDALTKSYFSEWINHHNK